MSIRMRFLIFSSFWLGCMCMLYACKDGISPVSPVPDVLVREEVNLNSVAAQPLRQRDGNYIFISGGIHGIIVYRKRQDEFLAFERKSPHNLDEDCGVLQVPSSQFYMEDTCHQCTFNWEGQPLSGPCRSIAKQYRVQFSNSYTLLITNP
jgi:nitrite reductase/ring-hydroxylating ferredoxin subunit